MSIGSRGAALSALGSGLMNLSGQIMNVGEARRQERAEAPMKALQQQAMEQQVAAGTAEQERLKKEEEAKQKMILIDQMLQEPEVAKLFQAKVQEGLEMVKKQGGGQAAPEEAAAPAAGPQDFDTMIDQRREELLSRRPQNMAGDIPEPQAQAGAMEQPEPVDEVSEIDRQLEKKKNWLKLAAEQGVDLTTGAASDRRRQYETEILNLENQKAQRESEKQEKEAARMQKQADYEREQADKIAGEQRGLENQKQLAAYRNALEGKDDNKGKALERKSVTQSSGIISDVGFGLGKLKTLRSKLASGDVNYLKRVVTGQIVDPELSDALYQLEELHGRQSSGAAISKSEWGNFQKQILNKNFLLTEQGKKAALNNLDDFIGRYYAKGEMVSGGNQNWFEEYNSAKQRGIEKVSGQKKDVTSEFDSLWGE